MFDWFIARKLDRIGRKANPDRRFVISLKKRITKKFRVGVFTWKLLGGIVASFVMVFAGTGAYAYASDAVLPGTPLYPLRKQIETVEEVIAPTPVAKARVAVRHMERRLREQEILSEQKDTVSEDQVKQFVGEMESTLDMTKSLNDPTIDRLDQRMADLEERFAKTLQTARDTQQTEKEKERVGTILDRQTKMLQDRVQQIESNRQAHFSALLKRYAKKPKTTQEINLEKQRVQETLDHVHQEAQDLEQAIETNDKEEFSDEPKADSFNEAEATAPIGAERQLERY